MLERLGANEQVNFTCADMFDLVGGDEFEIRAPSEPSTGHLERIGIGVDAQAGSDPPGPRQLIEKPAVGAAPVQRAIGGSVAQESK